MDDFPDIPTALRRTPARITPPQPITAVTVEVVDRDAIQIGELYSKARTSLVDSVRYQIECGQRLAEKKASLGHGEWLPWLEDNANILGFETRRTASRLMKLAANGTSTSHLNGTTAAQISRATWGNNASKKKTKSLDNTSIVPVNSDPAHSGEDWDYGPRGSHDEGVLVLRRRGFLWRASEAVRHAPFDDLVGIEIDAEMIAAALNAARAWASQVASMSESGWDMLAELRPTSTVSDPVFNCMFDLRRSISEALRHLPLEQHASLFTEARELVDEIAKAHHDLKIRPR